MSALLVLAGAALLWPVLADRHGRGIALSTLVALVLGTVAYGLARGPSWGGAAAFAAASAVVRLGWARWGIAGTRDIAARRRLPWVAAVVVSAFALLVRDAGPADVLDGLFSSWSGLLFWSPILWLAVLGAWRERASGPSAALLPAFLVAAAVGAVTADGGPHAGARFAPVLPLLAIALARGLAGLRDSARARPLLPVAVGIVVLATWNMLLMAQYRDGRIPRDDTVAFPRVARNAVSSVSGTVGSPTAWPANWIFAARHGVSAARYDLLGGTDLFGRVPPGAAAPREDGPAEVVIDIGHLPTDEAVLRGGWSVRHACGGAVCRAVEGRAVLEVPIRHPRDVEVTLVGEGAGTVTMAVNGVPVLEAPLASGQMRSIRVAGARFRSGLNSLALEAGGGPALVDRIVFRPVGP